MDAGTIVFLTFSNIVNPLSFNNLMDTFFEKRKSPVHILLLSYVPCTVILTLAFLMLNIILISLTLSLTLLFIITLNYESSMLKRFFVAAIILNLLVIAEFFTVFTLTGSGMAFLQPVGTAGQLSPYFFVIYSLVNYAFTFLIKKLFTNIKKDTLDSSIYLGAQLIISTISFVVAFLMMNHPTLPPFAITLIITALVGINMLTLYFLDRLSLSFEKRLETALHAQEKDFYFAQSQLMQESVKKVRAIRHDMNLHLSALRDFSTENADVTEYINNLLGDISESEVYSTTGNIAFDSIINFKLKSAREDNIKLDLSLLVPVQINIEIADIVTILGNLLNNALDAVAKVDDKRIILDIELSKGNLYIKIDNTFDGNVKYTDKEKHITTLKDGEEHGHGLNNIRKSVEKYNGHMDITHDGNIFSVGILLYV